MPPARRLSRWLLLCLLVTLNSPSSARAQDETKSWEFKVRFTEEARKQPFTGRVYVIFSRMRAEPRLGPNWFNPEMFLARDVTDWQPDTPLVISSKSDDGLLCYPQRLEELNLIGCRAQAVARFNPEVRDIGTGPGNGFSQVTMVQREGAQQELFIDEIVPEPKFRETSWTKLLSIRSESLSKFYGRDIYQHAAVILPASYYKQRERRYPTIFQIPGFGGDHFDGIVEEPIRESNPGDVEFLRVMLDPSCPLGHHVFADSANNGPRGRCLVEELLPEFDRQFRSVSEPAARFVTGHSSGGWSSLWLQMTYPDHFGGVWSTSPDPVDFRDFQRINLYQPGENMYVDRNGQKRPIARVAGRVVLWYQGFADMEWVLGPGGQLHSFEAAFSPRGPDGRPLLVFDRKTGAVNTEVARSWEKYDIRLLLQRNWDQLGPKLRGKLHVYMGDQDTFYLEGATRLLKLALEDLKSDAVIEIQAGKDHSNILSPEFRQRLRSEMAETFLKQNSGT